MTIRAVGWLCDRLTSVLFNALAFQENFDGPSVRVPDLEGDPHRGPDLEGVLYQKESGKRWNQRYFLLRASGIYYIPKGKTKVEPILYNNKP